MYTYFVSFKGGNKKKSLLSHKDGTIPLSDFSSFILCYFLEMDANLTGLLLFNFETTPCKNHSDTNLVKIH